MNFSLLTFFIFTLSSVLAKKSKKVPLNLVPEHANYLVYVTDHEPKQGFLPINTFAAHDKCNPENMNFTGCHGVLIKSNKAIVNR